MGADDSNLGFVADAFATLKKGRKEVPERTMTPELRHKFWPKKETEFGKILERKAATLISPEDAVEVRKTLGHRIVGSRFVNTMGPDPDSPDGMKLKSRWCVLGDKDPDVFRLAAGNATASPTISPAGRHTTYQLCATFRWPVNIGDVDGAFLNGDELEKVAPDRVARGGVFCELPPGGIPGIPPGTLIRLERCVYGLGDAPVAWWKKVQATMHKAGWRPSAMDPCLFRIYNDAGQLEGLACWHVDDVICTGRRSTYDRATAVVRAELPFRKWQVDEGDVCGVHIRRDPKTGTVYIGQAKYAAELTQLP